MRIVILTKNRYAKVDDEDYQDLIKHSWQALWVKNCPRIYAVRRRLFWEDPDRSNVMMHRQILGLSMFDKVDVDHINGDGLDNRRCNLRVCSRSENNTHSRMSKNNTSGFIGISFNKQYGKWEAHVCVNYKKICLGYFDCREDAVKTRLEAEKKYYGAFTPLR